MHPPEIDTVMIPLAVAPLSAFIAVVLHFLSAVTGLPLEPVRTGPMRGEAIGDRIVRFLPESANAASLPPSIALERPWPATGPPPAGFRTRPEYAFARGGHVVRIAIGDGTSLYGTGEVGGPLLRNGRTVVCWNTDAYSYGPNTPSLYQSHPWVLGVRADGSAFGVLADTPGRIVVAASWRWSARCGLRNRSRGRRFSFPP